MTDLSYITPDLRPLARPISELIGDQANARSHPERNLEALRASLASFTQRKNVVVQVKDDGTKVVRAGNGTLEAAKVLGWTHLAWAEVSEDDVQATAFAIADNRTAELAEWDDEVLSKLLVSLRDEGEDIGALGFDDRELEDLLGSLDAGRQGEDSEDLEPPAEPVSEVGRVYVLGDHRVGCGDSADADLVTRVLDGAVPNLMVTDPPYGVNYNPEWRVETGLAKEHQNVRTGTVTNDDQAAWQPNYALFPGDVAYVWHAAHFSHVVRQDMVGCGFETRAHIIWAKDQMVISRGHYNWKHEVAWYLVRKGKTASWIGGFKESTVWEIARNRKKDSEDATPDADALHGTQKPVEAMQRPIRNHEGDVYDPFLGSGTTLIAAQRQGRRCFGVELEPKYVDVIRKRWGDYARSAGIDPGPDAL